MGESNAQKPWEEAVPLRTGNQDEALMEWLGSMGGSFLR